MGSFTPASALAGGVLIGASAVLLLWLTGRLAGISTMAGGILARAPGDTLWRIVFLAALVGGVAAYGAFTGDFATPRAEFPAWLLIVSGLLVGYGTSLANGCTSGHGVCGLGRLSVRSLAATGTFLVFGLIATFVTRHVFGVLS